MYVLLTVGVTGNAVSSFIITVVLFIFYGFGLFSAFRYYRIAILVVSHRSCAVIEGRFFLRSDVSHVMMTKIDVSVAQ